MDKTAMKKVADDVFERYPEADKVHVTSDGQSFFDEVFAKNHAAPQKGRKELALETFCREENSTEFKTAKTLITEVKEAATIEVVTAISETEKAGENRKSVLEACERRIIELSKTE